MAHRGAFGSVIMTMPLAIPGMHKSNRFQPLKFIVNGFSENDFFGTEEPATIFECDASNVVVFGSYECVKSCMLP